MILVTGDLHGHIDIHKLNTTNFPLQSELTKEDYLIVCGDVGLVWGGNNAQSDEYWQKWLNDKSFTTLIVDGNHENHELLQQYPVTEWHGGKVHMIQPSVIHLMRGQVFNIDGKTFFTMGGASSLDKEYRKEGISWWPQELPSTEEYEEAERNLARHNWSVDYVITHCGPTLLQSCFNACYEPDKLTNYFDALACRLEWKTWYMGHYHREACLGKYRVLYHDIVEVRTDEQF